MMRSRINGFLAMLLVTAVVLGVMPAIKAQPPLPAMWMEPATLSFSTNTTSNGALFNVTLYAGTASDVYAYNWGVLYDTSQLAAVAGGYTGLGGARSQWFGSHATSSSGPLFDVPGEVYGGESVLGTDIVHASNGSVAWIEFQIIAAPDPGNTLTSTIDPNSADSYFLNNDLLRIPGVSFDHATYTFSGGGTPLPTRHDVVVSSLTPASDHVNQGQTLSIQVVVLNNGTVTETFDANATYDGTLIGTQTVSSLAAGNTQTLTFNWNTTGVAPGNYTITATATPPLGQTDLSNISKTATVQVLPPGPAQSPYDLDGDHNPHGTDINDVAVVAKAFGSSQNNPQGRWNPNADLYGPNGAPDGKVDLSDIAMIAKNFGKPE
jgi:hypothetical protein